MKEESALQQAVKALGGQSATAIALGVSPGLVWQWLNDRRPLPAEHCAQIEAAVRERGGKVACEDLLPGVHWSRDAAGRVTGYHVPLQQVS